MVTGRVPAVKRPSRRCRPTAMDRRQFAIATAAIAGRLLIDPFAPFSTLRAAATQNADALSPAYAKSVEDQRTD